MSSTFLNAVPVAGEINSPPKTRLQRWVISRSFVQNRWPWAAIYGVAGSWAMARLASAAWTATPPANETVSDAVGVVNRQTLPRAVKCIARLLRLTISAPRDVPFARLYAAA